MSKNTMNLSINIIWNFLAKRPLTSSHKKGCYYIVCAILNDETSLVYHIALEQEKVFQIIKIVQKRLLLAALISHEIELLQAGKWITNRIAGFKSFLFGEMTIHLKGKNPSV